MTLPENATAEDARNEIERLTLVLDKIEHDINDLMRRTDGYEAVRKAAKDLAHAHKSFRHALMSVMSTQDRLIDGPAKGGTA